MSTYPDIKSVLYAMHQNGQLIDGAQISSKFSITYDMSRIYTISEGIGTYLSAEQTALAASVQTPSVGDGTPTGYATAMIQLLNFQYATIFSDQSSGLSNITDITSCTLPYIDGNTHYTYHTDGIVWSIKYNNIHSILEGTVSPSHILYSTHTTGSPNNFMIEFPVHLNGTAGFATNFNSIITQSTSVAYGDPFIIPMIQ